MPVTRRAAPSATYKLLVRAMREREQVLCLSGGHPRELCPIILGHSDGKEKVLTFQFGGTSSRGLPRGGEWRCFFVSDLSEIRLRQGPWHNGSSHTQPQGCVKVVDLDVNPKSPYDPKRPLRAAGVTRKPRRGSRAGGGVQR